METVLAAEKDFEQILLEHDSSFQNVKDAIKIVKKFIIDNNLIIYGGTAIDYALRLKGSFEYSDAALQAPDLDFYSPDAVNHAYALADILFDAEFSAARAICGRHIDTMRVDMGDNHFIADIHHLPEEIFVKVPYIIYEGMRIVHPHFQFIDLHSSLAFPFDDPPTEVIFARWEKDVRRFNKLYDKYPIQTYDQRMKPTTITVRKINKGIWCGYLAYAVLYSRYKGSKDGIVPAEFSYTDGEVKFTGPRVELIHMKPSKCAEEIGAKIVEKYEAYSGILPSRCEALIGNTPIEIYSSHHRLLAINNIEISPGVFIRVVGIQYLLRFFAAIGSLHNDTPLGIEAWRRYKSLLTMIDRQPYSAEDINQSPFLLSINTYGGHNISHARQMAMRSAYATIHGDQFPLVPKTYMPSTAKLVGANRQRPYFNYESNSIFASRGRPLSQASYSDKEETPIEDS